MIEMEIPERIVRQIIRMAEEDSNGDDEKAYSLIERAVALQVLHDLLGDKWYKAEFQLEVDQPDLEAYPAARYARSFDCVSSIRLKRLAQSLEKVTHLEGFGNKRKELVGKRFDKVAFELFMAEYCLEMECPVSFILPKGSPSCDLLVSNNIHAECKFADDWPNGENGLRSKFENYVGETVEKIPIGSRGILIVCIPMNHIPTEDEKSMIASAMLTVINNLFISSSGIDRILAIRILTESLERIKNNKRCRSQYVRILTWRGSLYEDLPENVRKLIEDDQVRVKPRIWVNYKGLSSSHN
jgi:hypothetical protein